MKNNNQYFRHTFICPECENYNYRVTGNPDPCVSYASLDCGSCGKRIPMITHHATDVCLPPVMDSELIAAAIIFATLYPSTTCDLEKEELKGSALVVVRELQKQLTQ